MPGWRKTSIINDFNEMDHVDPAACAAVCRYLLARASLVGTTTSIVRTVQS